MQDRDTQRVYRLYDFTKAQLIPPDMAYCIAGKVNSAGKLYLVIESVRPDTKHARCAPWFWSSSVVMASVTCRVPTPAQRDLIINRAFVSAAYPTQEGAHREKRKARRPDSLSLRLGSCWKPLLCGGRRYDVHVFQDHAAGVRHVMAGRRRDINKFLGGNFSFRLAFEQSLTLTMEDHEGFLVLSGRVPPDRLPGFQSNEAASHARGLRRALQERTIAARALERKCQRLACGCLGAKRYSG